MIKVEVMLKEHTHGDNDQWRRDHLQRFVLDQRPDDQNGKA